MHRILAPDPLAGKATRPSLFAHAAPRRGSHRPCRAVQASAWFVAWLNGLELPDPALAAYARRRLARLGIAVAETEGGPT